MLINYRITACVIALVTGALIFRLVRRNLLHATYAAWWLMAGMFAVFIGFFPTIFDALGHALGVAYPPILFIVLTLVVFAIRMLISDLERTRMELTQRRLVQRYAQLALRQRDLERRLRAQGILVSRCATAQAPDVGEKEAADTLPLPKPPSQ